MGDKLNEVWPIQTVYVYFEQTALTCADTCKKSSDVQIHTSLVMPGLSLEECIRNW